MKGTRILTLTRVGNFKIIKGTIMHDINFCVHISESLSL